MDYQKNRKLIRPPGVRVVTDFASVSNMCVLLGRGGLKCPSPGSPRIPIDFLKVDIDSCDCSIAFALLRVVHPTVIHIEINAALPPPVRFSRFCHEDWFASYERTSRFGRQSITFGCSMSAAVAGFQAEGYIFHGMSQENAVFVHSSVAHLLDHDIRERGIDEFQCYSEIVRSPAMATFVPVRWLREWLAMPPGEDLLKSVWCRLVLHDVMLDMSHMPFTLSL